MHLELKVAKIIRNNTKSIINEQLNVTQQHIDSKITQLQTQLKRKAEDEIGNCQFIPNSLNKTQEILCHKMTYLLVSTSCSISVKITVTFKIMVLEATSRSQVV